MRGEGPCEGRCRKGVAGCEGRVGPSEITLDPHSNTAQELCGTTSTCYMSDGKLRAVPLHHRLDLLEACAELVNTEWPRSLGARIHALQKSCHDFPVCLVLLQRTTEGERLLGHARLSRVVGQSGSLFVESVVVSQEQRGKGHGRALMEAAERYAKARGFQRLCLTTHDKQHFYSHLGYVLSKPVQNAGAMTSFMPMEILEKFSRVHDPESLASPSSSVRSMSSSAMMAPQVVPLPVPISSQASNMPPAPPALPPPAPLLPNSGLMATPPVQTLLDTPYKDAKGLPIFWMHKDL
ncbi:N-acetyltransferase 6-like [Arapaima gigas]